jgi:hypothetical protein
MNRFLIILIIIVLCSCRDDWAFKEETIYLAEESKDWLTPDKYGTSFIMVDNNNISQGFLMNQNSTDFSPSESYYFGIRTRISRYESYTQAWTSNFGQMIMFILHAGSEPFGDRFSMSINGIDFMYDLKFKTIGNIYFNSSSKSKTMTDTGYEENETIYSKVELMDTLSVSGVKYYGILHFSLKDFKDEWSDFTTTEVYIARHTGLIKYSLNNGITYETLKHPKHPKCYENN